MKIFSLFMTVMYLILGNTADHIQKAEPIDEVISNASMSEIEVSDLFDSLIGNQSSIVLDDYYSSVYFSNLKDNFSVNSNGTCSYTAIGMLLSFYDSYWNDTFVPEEYDVKSNFSSPTTSVQDFELIPFDAQAPGIQSEPLDLVSNLSNDEYMNIVKENEEQYFQFKLIELSKTYFGSAKFDNATNPYGMTFNEIKGFMNYYLYTFLGMNSSNITVDSLSSTSNNVKSYVVNKITNGIPVLIRATSETLGGHAMIAYDYNHTTDEIYVHTGWKDENGNALRHVSLEEIGFTNLIDAISLNITSDHVHSYNYSCESSDSVCSCAYSFPQDIRLTSGNYRDMSPTFEWKSLYREKWFEAYDPYFNFSVLNGNNYLFFEVPNIEEKFYTLTFDQWEQILFDMTTSNYYVYINLYSDIYPYWDDYYDLKLFAKPSEYNDIPSIAPSEYGFEDAYTTDAYTKETFIEHTASNNFKFKTRRYRTGYIHNEYIVMSPKRAGYKEAYIEYKFDRAIKRIDVALSHWRSTSVEGLTSSTGTAVVQQFWGGKYSTKLDMLSASTNLSTDRNNQTVYKICFDQPIYWLRFYTSTFSENTNDNNRGRICIGNMAFYVDENSMPLSGSELDYNPSEWNSNSNIYDCSNCYSYALNAQRNPNGSMSFMQPGQSGNVISSYDDIVNTERLLSAIREDATNYGFTFRAVGKYEKCNPSTYKVALVVDPNDRGWSILTIDIDYHWYRQNSDGTWSHKPGNGKVRNTDYSNEIITDPETCDRQMNKDYNYTRFIGFFEVTPLNTKY